MDNIEILEKPWVCNACGCTNYCWREFCIHCLESNRISNTEKQKGTLGIVYESKNDIEAGISENNFLSDMALREIIYESHHHLYSSDFKKVINIYTQLIQKFKDEKDDKVYKLILLHTHLAIIQEQLLRIKKAAELFESALTLWDRHYDAKNDTYRKFLLHRLSACFSRLHYLPDYGPVYRPQKAARYLRRIYWLYKEHSAENSMELLQICISLTKLDFMRRRNSDGVVYLIESLELHENMFWSAVNRISNINTKAA